MNICRAEDLFICRQLQNILPSAIAMNIFAHTSRRTQSTQLLRQLSCHSNIRCFSSLFVRRLDSNTTIVGISAYPWTEWTSKLKSMRIGKQVDVLLLFSMILSCKYFYNALLCKNLLKNLIAMYIKHSVVAAIYIFVEVNHLMPYFNF